MLMETSAGVRFPAVLLYGARDAHLFAAFPLDPRKRRARSPTTLPVRKKVSLLRPRLAAIIHGVGGLRPSVAVATARSVPPGALAIWLASLRLATGHFFPGLLADLHNQGRDRRGSP